MDIEEYEPVKYTTEKFRKLYRTYEETKKKYRKIDFEDMLIQCRDLFMKRPDILKKWQEKFQYILVYEFQDVNQAQYDVVRMLAAPQDNLFVVGDDDQSVYGFRGAKPGIMMEFMKDYPKARQILLDVNYRSSGYIVKGALRVIGNNKIRFEKKIEAFRKPDETVHVQEVKDPVQEAEYVLEKIREYREKGVSYTEMAVLYRTNVDARAMSELMTEYQIPFVMKEHLNNIYEHFIALDMISYLRLSQGEYDRKYFLQIANRPNRYLTRESMKTGNVSYESLRRYYRDKDWMVDRIDQLEWDMKMICDKTPYAAIQYIRKRMGYDEFLKEYAAYRKISSEDLFAVLEEIWQNSKGYGTIKEWFEHIESYGKMLKEQNKKNGEKEGVNLMTMHAAKGLEFDTVFVIEANEGSCPYKKATADEEIEEERRLFYVAMTRAKRKLVISYAKEKNGKDLLPSRFVSELLLNVRFVEFLRIHPFIKCIRCNFIFFIVFNVAEVRFAVLGFIILIKINITSFIRLKIFVQRQQGNVFLACSFIYCEDCTFDDFVIVKCKLYCGVAFCFLCVAHIIVSFTNFKTYLNFNKESDDSSQTDKNVVKCSCM